MLERLKTCIWHTGSTAKRNYSIVYYKNLSFVVLRDIEAMVSRIMQPNDNFIRLHRLIDETPNTCIEMILFVMCNNNNRNFIFHEKIFSCDGMLHPN